MSIVLDEIVTIGGVAVAAIVERSARSCSSLPGASFVCIKRPVAVLIRHDDVTKAFDIDGGQIDLDEFVQRYPGQCAIFESRVQSDHRRA